jgi:hypothetical protein
MAGAKLFFLQRDPRLGVQLGDGLGHRLGAMTGDDDDIFGLKAAAGGKRVADHRHAAQTVQHLGQVRLHPAALPGGQDDDQCPTAFSVISPVACLPFFAGRST